MASNPVEPALSHPKFNTICAQLYGAGKQEHDRQRQRYAVAGEKFQSVYKQNEALLFSSPGRAEIGGNHTDHNGGKVLTASLSIDALAVAAPSGNDTIRLISEGYAEQYAVSLKELEPKAGEKGTAALIRGIAAGFKKNGFNVSGLNLYIYSDVLNGSGISSSAAVEMLLGQIINHFFNGGEVPLITIAKIGQASEHAYWHKPVGLLDQMACGVGGMIYIDFKDSVTPVVRKVNFDFSKQNYNLLIVNTGGDHSHLSGEYASVPHEMTAVAEYFGKKRCVDLDIKQVISHIPELRKAVGERCILRALHFFNENDRVDGQVTALESNEFEKFLSLVNASGSSSWRMLQNTYDISQAKYQEIPLALALTEQYIKDANIAGATRVHGGGFAGTIMALLPKAKVQGYVDLMKPIFGEASVMSLGVRPYGAICVNSLLES